MLAVWLAGNAVIVLLFFRHYIGVAELVVLCAFYYLSDMICILFFCCDSYSHFNSVFVVSEMQNGRK